MGGDALLTFTGTANQTYTQAGDVMDGLVTINKASGTVTLASAATWNAAGQNLTVTSGTLDAAGFALSTGTLTVAGGTYTAGSATQTFNGGLTVSSGTFTGSTGTVDVNGTVTISGTGILVAPAAAGAFTVSGNFAHTAGTFTHNSGTVTLDGTNQTVSGSTTFNNLRKTETTNDATDSILTFAAGTTQTILGTWTLDGLDADDRINLVSSTPGTQWRIDPQGARTIDYLDVQDSYNINSARVNAIGTNSVNSGNNSGWSFVTPVDFTWIGDGVDANWVTAANWQGGVAPGAANTAIFDDNSTKNSTVDAGFAGTIANLSINTGYTGTIDLARSLTINSAFSQAAGTFNGAGSAMTVSGNFALSGGTFTSTTGTLTVVGSWTHTAGGTFTHNNGTVVAGPGASGTWDVAGTETFNHLTVNKNAALTIAAGDTLIVGGTFTYTDGQIVTGTIQAQGAVAVGAGADGGSGTLQITSAGAQTIEGNGGILPTLRVSKPSGTLSLGTTNVTVGALTIDAANTLSGTTGTLTVGTATVIGNWTNTAGGTFLHNGGTVVAGGTGHRTWDVAGTETFNHLTVNTSNANLTIPAGDTLIVGGTFTYTDGVIVTGTVQAAGAVAVGAGADGGSGTLQITSAGAQTIEGNGGILPTLRVSKPSGTLSLGTTNVTVSTLTIDAANTLSSTTGTLTVGTATVIGNWTNTAGGTFLHNGGTVVAGGTGHRTWDVAGTETFNHLTVNTSNANLIIAAGDTLIVGGAFTHTDGVINTGTVEAQGAVTVGAGADGGSALLIFSGTANQTYTQSGNAMDGLVTVNKASGTVTLASATTWNAASQNLTVTSGTLDAAGFALSTGTLTVAAAGTVQLQGAETITATTVTLNAGSTIRYYGTAAAYTLKNYAYKNLIIDGGAATVFSFPANLTSISTLTLNNSITSLAGFNLTATTLVNNATVRLQGNETVTLTNGNDIDSGLWQYVGDGAGGLTSFTIQDFGATDYFNLTINSTEGSAESFSLTAPLTVAGAFTLSSGAFSQGAQTMNVAGNFALSNGTTFTKATGGQALTLDGTGNLSDSNGTLQDLGAVTISGSGLTRTLTGPVQFSTLNVTSGTYNANGNTTTVTGLTTVNGGTYTAGTATQTFNGGLTVSSGTFTGSTGTVDVNGTVTISGTGILVAPAAAGAFTVSGNFAHTAGTFTHNSGTVTLDGTNQTISGSTTFNHLSKTETTNDATDSILTFAAGTTQTILGTWTLDGLDADDRINLVSSTPGTQWRIDPQGARTIDYLDVQDSYNINSVRVNAIGTNSVNSGNNSGWSFVTPVDFTWIGDGVDANWVTAANWQGGVAPGAANTAIFDDNSTKNSTVDAGFAGTIANLNINTGYTGTIDLARALTINSAFTQAAGTFNGAGSAMTVVEAFTLSGGTFTSTTGTLTVNGDWTHTAGGTFTHNNGTVVSGFTALNPTWDVAGTETFNNFTMDKINRSLTIASGDTLIVGGTFTHTNGAILTGSIQAQGAVVVGAGAAGGDATVQITSAGAQTIEGNGGRLPSLRLSKPSGTLSLGTTNIGVTNLTIDAGNTLNSTTGTLAVTTGNWTNTAGGTFTHNNGTVVANGENGTWDVNVTETFNNLTVDKFNRTLTITAGDTLIVGGTFTYTNGVIFTGTLEAQGAVVVGAGAAGGNATVQITSAGAQTIEGNGGRPAHPSSEQALGDTVAGDDEYPRDQPDDRCGQHAEQYHGDADGH